MSCVLSRKVDEMTDFPTKLLIIVVAYLAVGVPVLIHLIRKCGVKDDE